MGTKENPGKFDCYANALPDEPMFILLARDDRAPQLVEEWATMSERRGTMTEKIAEARECAVAMRAWRSKYQSSKPEIIEPVKLTEEQRAIVEECDALKAMLLEKNAAYGNSALDPVRVFSKASTEEQIRVRIDDKLSRLARGSNAGEDPEADLSGYLILLRVHRRLKALAVRGDK
jgi:hypothetical protein